MNQGLICLLSEDVRVHFEEHELMENVPTAEEEMFL